jgi:lactate 2-monooxygenase
MPSFGDYQNEIYLNGLRGTRPKLPVDFKSIEAKACAALPPGILSYVQGGCGNERT